MHLARVRKRSTTVMNLLSSCDRPVTFLWALQQGPRRKVPRRVSRIRPAPGTFRCWCQSAVRAALV